MASTYSADGLDISHDDWEQLDRETQVHLASYDDGELRVLATFTNYEGNFNGRPAITTWSACEELLEGRWEGFVSIDSVIYK